MKQKLSFTFEEARLHILKKVAKREHRSVSNLVGKFIHDYIAEHHPDLLEGLDEQLKN